MHPESRLWIGDLWRVLVPWTCLIDAFQQVGVESVKLLNTFLFLARGLHPEDLREPAKVFHHFLQRSHRAPGLDAAWKKRAPGTVVPIRDWN
jgi:hypothetical protein